MRVIAIDPGMNVSGLAIFNDGELDETRTIKCKVKPADKKTTTLLNKARCWALELERLIIEYNPEIIVFEANLGYKSAAALRNMVMCYGMIVGEATQYYVHWAWVSPTDVKRVTGNPKADKQEIKKFVCHAYPDLSHNLPLDVYDAVAVYLAYMTREEG